MVWCIGRSGACLAISLMLPWVFMGNKTILMVKCISLFNLCTSSAYTKHPCLLRFPTNPLPSDLHTTYHLGPVGFPTCRSCTLEVERTDYLLRMYGKRVFVKRIQGQDFHPTRLQTFFMEDDKGKFTALKVRAYEVAFCN